MALPKRKSRKIVLGDIVYRYAISISGKENGEFDFHITVQNEKTNGSKLVLKGLVTRCFWLDFSDLVGEEIDWNAYPKITPKHIEYFINLAVEKGWDSNKRGANFILPVHNDQLNTGS